MQNLTLEPDLSDEMMLFDLDKDPAESTDVAPENPDVVSSLKSLVVASNLSCQCFQGPCRGPKKRRSQPRLPEFSPGPLHS